MAEIPDQKPMWDRKFAAGEHAEHRYTPFPFAVESEAAFPRQARVLELGCGVGGSALYFAQKGHNVLATDFSEVVIEQDKQEIQQPGLEFKVMDMEEPFELPDESFDAVYSHLSLHYFDDETTAGIVREIHRVLKPGGIFAFACKSPNDSYYGDGKEVLPGLFVSESGHARHFFTQEYATALVEGQFDIQTIRPSDEFFSGKTSHFVQCIAVKPDSGAKEG